jgi:putative PIN family toxin of toxin-antitoxin system
VTYFSQRREELRLVLDTSVLVAAFRSRKGASRRLIELFDQGLFQMVLSPALLLEYESVLTRSTQIEVHGYSAAVIDEFLRGIAAQAIHVTTHFQWRPQLSDPSDEFVLETAINGYAHAIVTHNAAHFVGGASRFGIDVFTPGRIIGQESLL